MASRWVLEPIPTELWEWRPESGTFQVAPAFWTMPRIDVGGRWAAVVFPAAEAVFGLGP